MAVPRCPLKHWSLGTGDLLGTPGAPLRRVDSVESSTLWVHFKLASSQVEFLQFPTDKNYVTEKPLWYSCLVIAFHVKNKLWKDLSDILHLARQVSLCYIIHQHNHEHPRLYTQHHNMFPRLTALALKETMLRDVRKICSSKNSTWAQYEQAKTRFCEIVLVRSDNDYLDINGKFWRRSLTLKEQSSEKSTFVCLPIQ